MPTLPLILAYVLVLLLVFFWVKRCMNLPYPIDNSLSFDFFLCISGYSKKSLIGAMVYNSLCEKKTHWRQQIIYILYDVFPIF